MPSVGCERRSADRARVEASGGAAIRPQWDVNGGARIARGPGPAREEPPRFLLFL